MKPNPVTVAPSMPVDQLVEDYFYKYHYKMLPITEGSRLEGCTPSPRSKKYLAGNALIAVLPNAEIGPFKPTESARFRFDGGDGLIMPRLK